MNGNDKKYTHWLPFVEMFTKANELGKEIGAAATTVIREDVKQENHLKNPGPTVLLCSPHPDDEILTGALPLRLLREENATIINLAITLGSDKDRKAARLKELQAACLVVGFQCRLAASPLALDNINPQAKGKTDWADKVKIIAEILLDVRPDIIIMPHREDNHPTHQGVNLLIMDALMGAHSRAPLRLTLIETEFWQPMRNPNLLLGINNDDLALLISALCEHKGEISRNPYHLSLPARLTDNVRRGREITGRRDSQPDFLFGELYRVSYWGNGEIIINDKPMMIGPGDKISNQLINFWK
jgi:LmbE family N-acetylglucosaminyl deacetylase